jgi:hypothetical protein
MNAPSDMHLLIKTNYALQYNLSNISQGVGLGATAYNPLPTDFSFVCLRGGGLSGAGTYVNLSLNWLCRH